MKNTSIRISISKAKLLLEEQKELIVVPQFKTPKEFITIQKAIGAAPYFSLNITIKTKEFKDTHLYPYYRFRSLSMNRGSCLTIASNPAEPHYELINFCDKPEW
jgi:hypothetical protein